MSISSVESNMKIPLLYKDQRENGHSSVRKAQLIEIHLLEVFKTICESHNLRFWLVGGTLLGALRHQGFIPWDDDLDVMILEKDYRKFLSVAKEELPDDVYLETPFMAPRMENHITRLRDMVDANNDCSQIVIDEIQKVPAVLDVVHALMEKFPEKRFVLTESSARKLKRAGVDLLGGRALKMNKISSGAQQSSKWCAPKPLMVRTTP